MAIHSSYTATNLPSHHPKDLEEDDLGYKDYANAFFKQIEVLKEKNSGIAFGIFGDWGIGKSSMLRMLRCKLAESKRYLIVEFDAWRYLKQEDLWLAFLRKIIAEIEKKESWGIFSINTALVRNRFQKSPNFASKVIRLAIAIPVIFILALLLAIVLINVISVHSQIIAWLIAGGSGIALLSTLLIKLVETVGLATKKISVDLPQLVGPGFDQGQSISIDNFLEDFQTIVRKVGEEKTIVVLVDDLDRCPPDQVVPVFEAIKHIGFDNKDASTNRASIIFVLAIDREAIEQSVRGYFKDYFQNLDDEEQKGFEISQFAREYVEKIIQIHFELPPLSRLQLNQLLSSQFKKFKEENPRVDEYTVNKIQSILSLNPMSQPRAVLQAYSAFLNRWEIIQQRDIQNEVFPEALAVLLVIQYVWPKVYERICSYPQHFFYLHALTTGAKNKFCSNIEIDEIRELGLAANEHEIQFAIIRQNEFSLLMNELDLSKWPKPISTLRSHLLLSSNEHHPQTRPEQIWEVLQSGDPVRIKYVLQENSIEVTKVFRGHTISFLAEISDQAKYNKTSVSSHDIESAEKVLVAAGIINDSQVIPAIIDLLESTSLTIRLQARAVYALGNYAAKNNELAISALIKFVQAKENITQTIQTRAAHLLKYCDIGNENIALLLEEIKITEHKKKASSLLRAIIKESIINANWWEQALEMIDPSLLSPEDIIDFCLGPQRQETSGKWPENLASYLIELAVNKPAFRERAYELLEGHKKEDVVIDWLATLSLKLAGIPESYEPWLKKCWTSMAEIQKKLLKEKNEDAWKKTTWESVIDFLKKNSWPEEMVGFVFVVSEIEDIETINFLSGMYKFAPSVGSWKRSIRQQLEIICTQNQNLGNFKDKACQVILEITNGELVKE